MNAGKTQQLLYDWSNNTGAIDMKRDGPVLDKKSSSGFELADHNSQFAKRFGSLRMNFCIFSKNCESLKSDTLWIFTLIHCTCYIVSYFKPIKYPPVEQQRDFTEIHST